MPPERMAAALYVLTRREKQGGSAPGQLTLLRLLLISHRKITLQAVPGSAQPFSRLGRAGRSCFADRCSSLCFPLRCCELRASSSLSYATFRSTCATTVPSRPPREPQPLLLPVF